MKTKMRQVLVFCLCVVLLCVAPGIWRGVAEAQEHNSDIDALLPQLQAADMRIRVQAYYTLSTIAALTDLAFLHQTLKEHPESRVRWRVARVLGRLGSKNSIPVLSAALSADESHYVRRNAAWALGDIDDHSAIAVLKQAMLSDKDTSVRKRAATALSSLAGTEGDRAIEAALRTEQDQDVRVSLEWLLERRKHAATTRVKIRRGEVLEGYYKGAQYLLYVPKTLWPWKRLNLLVSVHGTDGVPEPYLNMCLEDAEKYDLAVLAPRFDYPTFPNYDTLNLELGAMRSDLWLLDVIDEVAKKVNIYKEQFWLFGHSKGGQFVQRFVRAHPDRIVKAVASASGHYVHPSTELVFPEGTSLNPFTPDLTNLDFGKFVLTPLAVVIGAADLQRRLDEADRFMQEVRDYAAQHHLSCNITFFSVPDGLHVGAQNYPTASQFLFEKD